MNTTIIISALATFALMLMYLQWQTSREVKILQIERECLLSEAVQDKPNEAPEWTECISLHGLSGYGEAEVDENLIDLLNQRDHFRTRRYKESLEEENRLHEAYFLDKALGVKVA